MNDDCNKLEFFAYTRMPSKDDQAELLELQERLKLKVDADKYWSEHMVDYEEPCAAGFTTIDVLPELYGLPLNDLIMAYMPALRPSAIRITRGCTTTDGYPWRVTIYVDENDIVKSIDQEVRVGYSCGSDIGQCLAAAKMGQEPQAITGSICDVKRLERADFK